MIEIVLWVVVIASLFYLGLFPGEGKIKRGGIYRHIFTGTRVMVSDVTTQYVIFYNSSNERRIDSVFHFYNYYVEVE